MKKLILVVAVLIAAAGVVSIAATAARTHSVDYVIGMLEAGVPSSTIIERIDKGSLTFTLVEGDAERLRAAGADEALLRAVKEAEGTGVAAPPEAAQAPDKSQEWSRPQRLAEPQGTNGGGENLESGSPAQGETPHGGYPYYRPGYDYPYGYGGYAYDFYYGYPFYDPFYLPYYPYYYSYYGYYWPYYGGYYGPGYGHYHGGPGRVMPRGSGMYGPRGGGGHPPGGGGGAPHGRPVPRGSHH